jgi:hypothetical protein
LSSMDARRPPALVLKFLRLKEWFEPVAQLQRPLKNGFAAAQNLFRLKYDKAQICLKSAN